MSGDEEIVLCQCHDTIRNFINSCMFRYANTFVRIGSGKFPLLYLLGLLIMRGRLKSRGASGGVEVCFQLGMGDGDSGDPLGEGCLGNSLFVGLC